MTWFVTKKSSLLLVFLSKRVKRGTGKHSYWSKIFFGPMKMFSCPPSINKNKEVTNFCDKSRHLFLWQTNRTRLIWFVKNYLALLGLLGIINENYFQFRQDRLEKNDKLNKYRKNRYCLKSVIVKYINPTWPSISHIFSR